MEVLAKAVRQEQEKRKQQGLERKKTKLPLSIDDVFVYTKNIQINYYREFSNVARYRVSIQTPIMFLLTYKKQNF